MSKNFVQTKCPIDSTDSRVKEFLEFLLRMSGGEHNLQAPISPRRDDFDAIIHAVNVMVGELAGAKREAEDANRNKSQFIASLCHEIRTPLSIIMGFLAEYEVEKSDQDRKKLVTRAYIQAEHMLELMNQMLDFSSIDRNKKSRVLSVKGIAKEMSGFMDAFEGKARDKGLYLDLKIEKGVDAYVETDYQKFRQIVMNLIHNALKNTKNGGVKVEVSKKSIQTVNNALCVVVSDTGIGIAPEIHKKIFERFENFSHEVQEMEKAMGLGLPIIKELAQFLGGDVFLQKSVQGKGSVFCCYMPVKWCPNESNVHKQIDKTYADHGSLEGKRILIAEDTQDLLELFKLYLASSGAKITTALNGEIVLSECAKQDFDLILMDINMPKLDGMAATIALRKSGYTGLIVALTAHAHVEILNSYIDRGCDDFITKPVLRDGFLEKLSSLLS